MLTIEHYRALWIINPISEHYFLFYAWVFCIISQFWPNLTLWRICPQASRWSRSYTAYSWGTISKRKHHTSFQALWKRERDREREPSAVWTDRERERDMTPCHHFLSPPVNSCLSPPMSCPAKFLPRFSYSQSSHHFRFTQIEIMLARINTQVFENKAGIHD